MGRSPSPTLRRELENLDKDADTRKSAMEALKLYVKDLDSDSIPVFLTRVSETEHTVSMYEVLARVQGPKIVPHIDNIMNSIVKTLSSSTGDFALHQVCAKVVRAIARYAIDPTSSEDRKRLVIHSLCKPLSDCLLCTQENLSSGAALCSQALVESDNWRFCSSEMINEVCQRVAGALENHSQTNPHMTLVMSLAKHNSLIVEDYSRLLIRSGLRILGEGNSQKQVSAIHMVSSLMKYLDQRSLLSELEMVMREMEKFKTDRMSLVAEAALEALRIAKKICAENGLRFDKTGSSSSSGEEEESPYTASPELQNMGSFMGCEYYIESPKSTNLSFQSNDCRNMSHKHWRGENGIVGRNAPSPKVRRFRSPITMRRHQDMMRRKKYDRDSFFSGDELQCSSESVCSENDVFREEDPMLLAAEEAVLGHKAQPERARFPALKNSARSIVYGLFAVLFAMLLCLLAIGNRDDRDVIVPT